MSYLDRAITQAQKELDRINVRRKELTKFLRANGQEIRLSKGGRKGFIKPNVITTALQLLEDKSYITINDIIENCEANNLSLGQQDNDAKQTYIGQILTNSNLFVNNRRYGWSKA